MESQRKDLIILPKNRKNKFKKSKKSIIPKYIVVFIIVPVISLVIYSIIYLIVYSRTRSNIHKKSIKEINSNSGTDKFKNITELLISNNDIDKDKNSNKNNNTQLNLNKYADKVNYIDGKLIWNHSGGSGGLIGFTKDHKLYLTD